MKFDPSIIFFVVFIFFVLLSILKKNLKIKKERHADDAGEINTVPKMKTTAERIAIFKGKSKNVSKLGQLILQYGQSLKKAAEQERQKQKEQKKVSMHNAEKTTTHRKNDVDNIWDILAENTDNNSDESQTNITQNQPVYNQSQYDEQNDFDSYDKKPKGIASKQKTIYSKNKKTLWKSNGRDEKPYGTQSALFVDNSVKCKFRTNDSQKRRYRLKHNHLQNAVIWSEILSEPVTMRDD